MNPYQFDTSAAERLLTVLKSQIETISVANGYWNDMGDTFIGAIPTRADVTNYPVGVVIVGKEDVLNTDIADELLHKYLYCGVAIYMQPQDDVSPDTARQFQQRAKADFERLLGNNWMLNENDVPHCRLAMVIGSEPFTKIDGQTYIGIMLKVRILYAQDIYDPSVLA